MLAAAVTVVPKVTVWASPGPVLEEANRVAWMGLNLIGEIANELGGKFVVEDNRPRP